jgi:hypothetical protein
MTKRSCRGCGRKVDTSAKSYPNRERPHPANSGLGILKISAGVVTVLIMVLTIRPSVGAADDSTGGNSPALADLQTITAGLLPDEAGDLLLVSAFVSGSGQGNRNRNPHPSSWAAEGEYVWRDGHLAEDLKPVVATIVCFEKAPDPSDDVTYCSSPRRKRTLRNGIKACLSPREKKASSIGGTLVDWPSCSISFKWGEMDNKHEAQAWKAAEAASEWVRDMRAMSQTDAVQKAKGRERLQVAIRRATTAALNQNRK